MRHLRFIALVLLALGLGGIGSAVAQEFAVPNAAYQYQFDKINEFRAQNGLPRLKAGFGPGTVAEKYAYFLAANNKSGHFDDGLDPIKRMQAAAAAAKTARDKDLYKFCGLWENTHHSWTTGSQDDYKAAIDKAMDFWKNSPGHRANMLNPKIQTIGQGIKGWKWGNDYYYKEVVMFVDRTSC